MHGCGNDYIYLNGFDPHVNDILQQKPLDPLSVFLSDRHFGVGGDGIVLILPSDVADARMRMFNLDGSEGKMCGNAIRCVAKYLFDYDIVPKQAMTIETLSGIKHLFLKTQDGRVKHVKVDMGEALFSPEQIPVSLDGSMIVNRSIQVAEKNYSITCVSMGNPHAVVFCDDIESLDLPTIGPLFEHHPIFPERVNTEFVRICGKNSLKMRVWERGSGETLACGTGACASVVAAVLNGHCDKNTDVKVDLLGGSLTIRYTTQTVFMTGGCEKVFEGVISV